MNRLMILLFWVLRYDLYTMQQNSLILNLLVLNNMKVYLLIC